MTIRVGILGATGYTAFELARILLRHNGAKITALTTRQDDRPHVSSVHPQLTGRLDLHLENLSLDELAERCDCIFGCLPHAASAAVVPGLLERGLKVVDLSADYRLRDVAVYEKWYGEKHPDPARLPNSVYGLPELFRDTIRGAELIANPGCYPTSATLALAPLLKNGMIQPTDILVDSKSGVSGAGRTPKLGTLYCEVNESFSAYGVGTHRHMPEIEQNLQQASGQKCSVIFTPHLVPMDRGILSTCYAKPTGPVTTAEAIAALREFYADEPFVQVIDGMPATKSVSGTNYCHLTARVVNDRIIVIAVIDNLIKGASGAAVQNFNLMYDLAETTALVD
ncbi:N-acetyl-gamma-glutamyl-phosphate reductase [Blastopirellula sp. JC732]|uniref:N-acetyl-gamma-glutamyl-phosphate reductase n=1 Tax=Blastopirellula sediminis TaxID=2894196 RepID=A0A9X1SFQ0_9BACT|nr:N-acetyl-gamma-glutamyl-phosphate reductase [Blastopirellula sediminis]MCC9609236.1 N-acetyl-gamma-glutamyl-phosphate reductase [Blastopirellula sediminis]MCC9627987.1 N-acetyl-gamma-glutamyl-phosphate reductase [Blastopirellula sediminis]